MHTDDGNDRPIDSKRASALPAGEGQWRPPGDGGWLTVAVGFALTCATALRRPGVHGMQPANDTTASVSPLPVDHRGRIMRGTLFRFDSITQMVAFCRRRYGTDDVRYGYWTGELLLAVARASGEAFVSLIVHFEGEGVYAVLLPDP